jgi:hypothetical protein
MPLNTTPEFYSMYGCVYGLVVIHCYSALHGEDFPMSLLFEKCAEGWGVQVSDRVLT